MPTAGWWEALWPDPAGVLAAVGVNFGRVGFISPMTENFCGSCNRLRLSAAGSLHNCLARDDAGDLRSVLRSEGAVARAARVRAVLGYKQSGHTFALDGHGGPDKAMISIGG